MDNQKDIANLALRAGVATEVFSPAEFREHVNGILSLPIADRGVLGTRARNLIDSNLGVSEQYVNRVLMLLSH
jgi:hypothetical protein